MYNPTLLLEAPWQEDPFPHTVIDGLWDPVALRGAQQEFPFYDDPRWITYDDPEEIGKKAGPEPLWGEETHSFFQQVRGAMFTGLLERASGISPLTPDSLGGGMHMTGPEGRLEMHIDFNVHPDDPGLERRLNVLVFLNPLWEKEWGGVLYLGRDRDIGILPTFNRTVIFECSEESFHGHPEAIVGEHYRRSLACYFYAPVDEETAPSHTTVWSHNA